MASPDDMIYVVSGGGGHEWNKIEEESPAIDPSSPNFTITVKANGPIEAGRLVTCGDTDTSHADEVFNRITIINGIATLNTPDDGHVRYGREVPFGLESADTYRDDQTINSGYIMRDWIHDSIFTGADFAGLDVRALDPLAKKRAKEFLCKWISKEEYKDLQKGGLSIKSKIYPYRKYIVDKDANKMIKVMENSHHSFNLCVVSKNGKYENDDTLLAKILLIKTNEKKFLSIAEEWPANSQNIETPGFVIDESLPNETIFLHLAEATRAIRSLPRESFFNPIGI